MFCIQRFDGCVRLLCYVRQILSLSRPCLGCVFIGHGPCTCWLCLGIAAGLFLMLLLGLQVRTSLPYEVEHRPFIRCPIAHLLSQGSCFLECVHQLASALAHCLRSVVQPRWVRHLYLAHVQC